MASNDVLLAARNHVIPDNEWHELPAASRGWSSERLAALALELENGPSTAFMIVQSGHLVFQWGDIALKSSIASVRKSLINVLYGIYIAEGRIDPNATLAELEIDDNEPLTPAERKATVMDLLMARSGIYLPSVYNTEAGRPSRGSYPPGSHWFYNNWDFNALGTIVERTTGQNVFDGLVSRLVIPLGMQDCEPGDGWFQHGPESSHPVYKIRMSARDLARVGLLYLRQGRWGTKQLVPESWVRDSTLPHSQVGAGHGYGYLWWATAANASGDSMATHASMFYASGWGGQYIIVLPKLDLVVVHRSAPSSKVGNGVSHVRMGEILRLALAACPNRDSVY
ncbi:serine hydrolase domain-containing protein [Rhizobium leguminosarum]|uniref:Beta-lactamase family protein n=1 Tax=Rhizobium leguminosarum TaxID=384 RepID=A0A2Z4YEW9_RHILE|nr:serine hydrolase [Rhizobium leguminosarum]AXA39836.1 Beta-lactamase family protein [Rhizobium leguminosarum]